MNLNSSLVNLANDALITNEISICVRLSLAYIWLATSAIGRIINNLLIHKQQQQLENNEIPRIVH